MKIKEIKITDELMSALVDKFFTSKVINSKRMEENILRREMPSWHPESVEIPPLSVEVNAKINISEEEANRYYDIMNGYMQGAFRFPPHFSLVSDNAENDLQVYADRIYVGSESINTENLSCKTEYYEIVDEKYYFHNK